MLMTPITPEAVLKALSYVEEPDLGKDLVTLNMIENVQIDGPKVSFTVVLTTPACPLKELIHNACVRAIHTMVDPGAEVTVNMTSRVTTMRQMLNSALELDSTLASKRLTEQSIAQNEQVKQISSWAAIIFAPQLVGSVYGMNFDGMPELHWAFGYPFALGLMLAVALTLFVLFKRADWL